MKLIQEKPYEILKALRPQLGNQWIDSPEARDHVDTTQSHFHQTVSKLKSEDLVEKRKHPSKGRVNQYKLTDQGIKVLENLQNARQVIQ